jgi:CheY-like chemotaxis protein
MSPDENDAQPSSRLTQERHMKDAPISILLVEDDPGDVLITKRALARGKIRNRVHVVNDGDAAMAYLRGNGKDGSSGRPDLVLLDLNLPRRDGRDVLREMKSDPGLRSIPVIVLTTSDAEEDVARSYELHANLYVTKPVHVEEFLDVVRQIDEFFLTVVRLPPPRESPLAAN